MKIRRVIPRIRMFKGEGEALPWWYGFAGMDFYSAKFVCYPIPLNYVVIWLKKFVNSKFYLTLRGPKTAWDERARIKKAWEDGYKAGLRECIGYRAIYGQGRDDSTEKRDGGET